MASDWEGVALGDGNLFTVSPTWDRLDAGVAGLRVTGIEIIRGRRSIWERTDTGTCTVTFNDRAGALDPTFVGSIISRPFAVAIRNPVTDEWFPLFRGVVDDVGLTMRRSQVNLETVVVAVDLFDYFSNYELIPGAAGGTHGLMNADGYIVYNEAPFDERVENILEDAGLTDPDMFAVFSGNIICRQSVYSSGDRVMQALEEAVDAEFPTVANHYVDKIGRYQTHGRYARFVPDTIGEESPKWDFARWKAGDDAACAADVERARMQEPYALSDSRADIRNVAVCYPERATQVDLDTYTYSNAASRLAHGTRTWTAPNLQIKEETSIGLTAKENCQLVAEYIVKNYKDPLPRIPAVTVGTIHPDHFSAAATWAYICGVDISDIVNVEVAHPGGGGSLGADYYVEGISIVIEPGPGDLDDAYPIVKHTVDLSSVDHWADNPFGTYPPTARA